jgi:hypothetical protein
MSDWRDKNVKNDSAYCVVLNGKEPAKEAKNGDAS